MDQDKEPREFDEGIIMVIILNYLLEKDINYLDDIVK